MAGSVREDDGAGRSSEGISIGQQCQSGDSLSEWHSSEQVENGTHSTPPPYWDTDSNDDCGAKPSELYGKFTWKIENFSQINKRELRSNAFEVGGCKWYILIYPQGCDVCNHLSLFLCVANHDKLLRGWSHFAQFTIAVVNKDPKKSRYSDTLHRFWKKEHDWGWKKFMELTKVSDGFIVSDTLVIKAQVQVIGEKACRPFRCLDRQYRRELVRVYLSNVELICRRFVDEQRGVLGNLIEDKVRWSSFRAFWLGVDQNVRQQMSRDKTDAILKDVVKSFFIEKEVTSTLVMDSLYSGLRALEAQNKNKKGMVKSVEMEEIPAPIVFVEKDMFVLADDVLLLLQRAANEPLPPKDDKGPQNRMKDGSSGDDFSKDSIERDERRLTELGRRTLEIFVLAQIFRNLMDSHNNSMAADWRTQLLPESHNNYSSAGWDVKHLSWGVSSAPTGHSDVVDSQEVDEKGQQSSDEEEFDDAPDDDEYDTEDSFIDDAELEPVSPQQPGQRQFQQSFGQLHLMTQQPQSRIPQLQQEENQVNLIEKMNIQGPVTTMQSTAVSSSQQGSISLSAHVEVENGQQKMVTGFQPSSDLESASGHTLSSLPQDMVGSLPRNTIDAPHLTNNSTWSHNVIQLQHGTNSLELNSIILQEQHLKQQKQEQQLKNEYEHHQLVQKFIQQQQMLQPLQLQEQQRKQQELLQLQALAGGKTGMFPHLTGQHETAYPQLKTGPPCLDPSPQLLRATSLQLPQHSSLETSPRNLPSTVPKAGTSLQFAPYPCIGTLTPISVRPSPIPAGSKKPPSFISSIPNAENIGHQETVHGLNKAQYLSIGTPGMLTSPLLPELSSVSGKHGNASQNIFGKLNATERPPERLTKAVLLSLMLFLVLLIIYFSA